MYKLSARQVLIIALLSGVFAATTVAIFDRFGHLFQPKSIAYNETPLKGITDPTLATDEQNNIEVYKAIAPGVVNVHSMSYVRDFIGMVEPPEGSGSGSVI